MGRDKNPSLSITCIICRQKNVNELQIKGEAADDILRLRALSFEALFLLFGFPADHPFSSIFLNSERDQRKGQLCNQCFQDSNDAQFVFWQLRNLEERLLGCQERIFKRLKSNYDSVPVATLFGTVGVADVKSNLENLSYFEIVKILFESIKDRKEEWPKSSYALKWKRAREKADDVVKTAGIQNSTEENEYGGLLEDKSDIDNVKMEGRSEKNAAAVCIKEPGLISTGPGTATAQKSSVKLDELKLSPTHQVDDESWLLDDQDGGDEWNVKTKRKRPTRKNTVGSTSRRGSKRKRKVSVKAEALSVSQDGKNMHQCTEEPTVCSRTFKSAKKLKTHIRTCHHIDEILPCDHEGCSKSFATSKMLQNHKSRAHAENGQKEKQSEVCETCGITVPRGELKKHYYLRHVGIGEFTCDICSMDFNDPEECKLHQVLHVTAEFPFMCVVCQNLFTNSLDLKNHVSSNHMSSGLKCEKCGIMKPNEYLLQRHMKVHEQTRSYVCECGKSFASKGYLNYHKEHFHTNVGKKFPCEICGKSFLHMKNAVRHLVTHRDDKPHKCKICSKTFNYSHLLKKHEEIHSGTKNYGCEICGKRFRQYQNLTQHMRSHKPKPAKPPKKQTRKATSPPSPNINEEEDIVPVILNVQGDEGNLKTLVSEVKADSEIVATTTLTIPNESNATHFETVHEIREIKINHPSLDQQTATVVFVTTDPSFHWIA